MGTFSTETEIVNIADRTSKVTVPAMPVDTGSEYTWAPSKELERIGIEREKRDLQFVLANGQVVNRAVGFAIVRVGASFTVDEVVFAEEGDLLLLGARSLEGLNLTVDPSGKKLVAAGPLPAAPSE